MASFKIGKEIHRVAEGATGAPRIELPAIPDNRYIGHVTGSETTLNGWTNLDEPKRVYFDLRAFHTRSSNVTLQFRVSNNNGSTWSGYYSALIMGTEGGSSNKYGFGMIVFDFVTGVYIGTSNGYGAVLHFTVVSGTVDRTDINAIQWRLSAGPGTYHVIASTDAGRG